MAPWTEDRIPDLSGKVAIVTGANSGLGLETTRALAAKGALVVLACRNAAKAEEAMASIRAGLPDAKLEFLALDLASLASVKVAAETFLARHPQLHLLCNNAGLMGLPYSTTADGFEMLLGANHLGHFAFTGLLLPALRNTPGGRVITVSSLTERKGRIDLDDLPWQKTPYKRAGAYARSKLANMLFALELDRRLRRAGLPISSLAAHPGYSATNIVYGGGKQGVSLLRKLWNQMAALGNVLLAQPAALGALPTLYAATAPDLQGGDYIGPDGFIQFRGYPVKVQPSRQAQDPVLAAALWQRSEELTGVRFRL